MWHACLTQVTTECDPRTWGQAAEWFLALAVMAVAVLGFWAGFYLLLEWFWSRG